MTKDELNANVSAYRLKLNTATETLTDEVALECISLFSEWKSGAFYKAAERVRYEGVLYVCLQEHTAQDNWFPTNAPSLWAKVLIPDPSVIPEWEQPESTNPYMKGDKVTHNEKIWISTIDNNVWEPGVYGWDEIV